MKIPSYVRAASVLAAVGTLVLATSGASSPQLLYETDLHYTGAFRLPSGHFGETADTFDYSGGFVAGNVYTDPAHGKSLFITGYLSGLQVSNRVSVAHIAIPGTVLDPQVVGPSGLSTATTIQGFADPSHGIGSQILTANGYGSLVVYSGKLIGTEAIAYDATCGQTKSAWVSPIAFSQSDKASGPYAFSESNTPRIKGGGFMALVPAEWRAALGGAVVSGNGPSSIISCGTPGPSLWVIDADTLAAQPPASTTITAHPLVYYEDGAHSSLGLWNSNAPGQMVGGKRVPSVTVVDPHGRGNYTFAYEDNAMRIQGVLFPDETRSVLFFGRKGMGKYCYGVGSACGDLDGPTASGDHAYPYTEFVWAYDVDDLIAVRQGHKKPWEVLPYSGWAFKVFGDGDGGASVGVAWDPTTRLAYLLVTYTNGPAPLVHVFSVGKGSSSGSERSQNTAKTPAK
jgi:hypothetical protein